MMQGIIDLHHDIFFSYYWTSWIVENWMIVLGVITLFLVFMADRQSLSSRGSTSALEPKLDLTAFGGSDDEGDPERRKRINVNKRCYQKGVEFL